MDKASQNTKKFVKREVGIQSIIQPKLYDSPHILAQKNLETVEYSKLFYTSHTLIALFLAVVCLHILIKYSENWNLYDIKILSLKAWVLWVLLFSSFYMPDTIVTRPHPFIWRMVLGANLIYAAFLVYMSFLPLEEARNTMKIFDPRLGGPLPEKSYAYDWRIFTPDDPISMFRNLRDAMDIHVLAHFLGWVCKVLIMRDIKLWWIWSIAFELLEITFRHWLPNFYECWWDHLILDLFGCNMIGIMIGAFILRKFSVVKLNWIYAKQKSDEKYLYSECSAINRAFTKLRPEFLIKHNWEVFKSLKRFYGIIFYWIIVNLVDLDNFFMKRILNIAPEHDILKWRLLIWCPLALAGSEEYFEYLTNKYSKRVRPHMWLILLLLNLEVGFVIKHSNVFTGNPFPNHVKILWGSILASIVFISIWILYKNKGRKDEEIEWNPYNPPIDIKEVEN